MGFEEKIVGPINTRCCCCECNKKFCLIWKIITIIFSIFKYLVLALYCFYFSNQNRNYYEEIVNNWNSYPITEIDIYDGDDFKSNNIGSLNGVDKNYYIHSLYGKNLKFYYDKDYKYNITSNYYDDLFKYNYEPRYVVFVSLSEGDGCWPFHRHQINLGENKCLRYSMGLEGFYVQSKFAGRENRCENKINKYKNDICSSLDNCNQGKKLLNKKDCVIDDIHDYYRKIGRINITRFIIDNDINLKNEIYDKDDEIFFLMRGYIELNKSDECVKNLESSEKYVGVYKEKKTLDIVILVYSIVMLICEIFMHCYIISYNSGNSSKCLDQTAGIIMSFYLITIISFSIILIIAFNNVRLIFRDFDECIIPNLKKNFKFTKTNKLIMKLYPIVLNIIILTEIIDKFATFFKLCCFDCCCCKNTG